MKQIQVHYGLSEINYSTYDTQLQLEFLHRFQEFIREIWRKYGTLESPEDDALGKLFCDQWRSTPRLNLSRVAYLWERKNAQAYWHAKAGVVVSNTLEYFVSRLEAMKTSPFKPTETDYILSTHLTIGMCLDRFNYWDNEITVVDVGGTYPERRKWIEPMKAARAIIFVVAVSEFNQFVYRDPKKNVFEETKRVFQSILNRDLLIVLIIRKNTLT